MLAWQTRFNLRIAPLLAFACAFVAAPSSGGAADDKDPGPAALTNAKANNVWTIGGRRNDELIFVKGDGHEPVIEFNSHAFRGREVGVEIATDTNHLVIVNNAGEVELRLEPAKKYRFYFDGDADKPKLKIANTELHLHSPEWGRIINDKRIHTFRLMILDATEVAIKLKVRNGEIPLRSPKKDEGE